MDQDLLNWFCKGNFVQLDKKYNVFSWWEDAITYTNDCIIHYTIGKPWKRYNGDIDEFYWDYLVKTPWCKTRQQYTKYLRDSPNIRKVMTIMSNNFFSILDGSAYDKIMTVPRFIISILKNCTRDGITHILGSMKKIG